MIVPTCRETGLTPDERRQLGLAVLTTAMVTLATGLINWGLEEAKSFIAKRRKASTAQTTTECRSDPVVDRLQP